MYKITITVESLWAAQKLTNLLWAIKRLGDWGASRWVFTDWDGDGGDKIISLESDIKPNFEDGWTDKEAVGIWNGKIQSASIKGLLS